MTYDPLKHLTDSAEKLHLMARGMEDDEGYEESCAALHAYLSDCAHDLRELSAIIASAADMIRMERMLAGKGAGPVTGDEGTVVGNLTPDPSEVKP